MATAPRVPTIQEVADGLISAWATAFNITIPLIPKSFFRVAAWTIAAVYVTLFKYAAYNFLQQYAETADLAETEILGVTVRPLEALAAERGIGAPDPATQAEFTVNGSVIVPAGTIQTGEQLLGVTNGVTYLFTAPVALTGPTFTGAVRAAADQAGGNGAGAIGNLAPGASLVFANPRGEVAREVTVGVIITTAADGETEDAYRARVLDAYQKQPSGGNAASYERWSKAVAGIISAYPYRGANTGEVAVYCEADPVSSGSPDGIPTGAQLAAVLAAVAAEAPLSDYPMIYPITRTAFVVRVVGLTAADLAGCKAAVAAALEAQYRAYEPYVVGLTVGARRDTVTEAEAVATAAAVIRAFEGTYTAIYQEIGGVRTVHYVLGEGEKAKATAAWI